jgi:chemotaxis protein methyltransferase CheR
MPLLTASEIEISSLLEALYKKYGYDFRGYSRAHITRRIQNRMGQCGIETVGELQARIIRDETLASRLLQDFSITITEMFRDPSFYKTLREVVVPILKTYSFIKIWHAGTATGEEAYSMAILLQEEGLYDRSTIYATDFNQSALEQAKQGVFRNSLVKQYTENYFKSGGKQSFSDYYTSDHEMVIMNKSLKKNIVWANHNLVTDSVFAEVHLILCRNVLIYFTKELQNRVQRLFFDSLAAGGILCLGNKESLRFTDCVEGYNPLDAKERIYKKIYHFTEH